jgi:hypothetical protein
VIKFVFRWAFRLLLLITVLVIGILLLKDNIARSYAEQRIRAETGFDAKVGSLQLGLLEPRVTIENLVLYNPPEFGGSPALNAPDIQFDYVPGKLALQKVHLRFLRLTITELNIVESNGRTNILDLLRRISPGLGSDSKGTDGRSGFAGIDLLNLSIGKVRYTDLGRPKRNQEINLNLENYIVRNVKSEEDFANILLKMIFRAGFTIYVDARPEQNRRSDPQRVRN